MSPRLSAASNASAEVSRAPGFRTALMHRVRVKDRSLWQKIDSNMILVYAKSESDGICWDKFVQKSPAATCYHRWNWKQVIEHSFDWPTYYLMAMDNGQVAGLLPLVWQKSPLFGSFMTSLPFLN